MDCLCPKCGIYLKNKIDLTQHDDVYHNPYTFDFPQVTNEVVETMTEKEKFYWDKYYQQFQK